MTIEQDIRLIESIRAVPQVLRAITEMSGLRFVSIARVTEVDFTICAVLDDMDFGLGVGAQVDVATTLCRDVCRSMRPIVIDHASLDPVFWDHPTPKTYGFESYVSVPVLRADGKYFGTLFAFDRLPLEISKTPTLGSMTLFAELIGQQLETETKLDRSQDALELERRNGELREQFIGVLGHDLRTPLQSICMGMEMALRLPVEPMLRKLLEGALGSGQRIAALADDLMDFAHGRLGTGLQLDFVETTTLAATIRQVIDELQNTHPDRTIISHIEIDGVFYCSPGRIGQLLSNLLINALKYGEPGQPVSVRAMLADDTLQILVSNFGQPIPQENRQRLFQPYWRGEGHDQSAGLGLGLYIASEIAKSHGGELGVDSKAGVTTFSFLCNGRHAPARAQDQPARLPAAE
ncbi:MAG: GAF domain-containing sensor histidine kinase [Janthinobacterium lividum]